MSNQTYRVTVRYSGSPETRDSIERAISMIKFVDAVESVSPGLPNLVHIGPVNCYLVTIADHATPAGVKLVLSAIRAIRDVHSVTPEKEEPLPAASRRNTLVVVWENPDTEQSLDHVSVHSHGSEYTKCCVYFGGNNEPVTIVRYRHGFHPQFQAEQKLWRRQPED